MAYHLYWISGSPPSWRVMLGLNLKKLRFTETRFLTEDEEHKGQPYLMLNPRGEVPTLVTPDGPVRESLAILAYLDRVKPDPPLFGRTATEAGVIWSWIMDYEHHLRPAMTVMTGIAFGFREETHEGELEASIRQGCEEMQTILRRLKLMPWLGGNQVSAADIAFYPGVQWMRRALRRLPDGPLHDVMEDAALLRWEKKIEKLPKFTDTWPPHWREADAQAAE